MQAAYHKRSTARLMATCAALIVIAGLVVFADHLKSAASSAALSSRVGSSVAIKASSTSTGASSTRPASSIYQDGTYTARSDYYVPNGYENIQVTLTLKDGVVTNTDVINSEGDPESAYFQQSFASMYKSHVVGKNAADIHLSYVAGASDTTQGFNDALTQILSKAHV